MSFKNNHFLVCRVCFKTDQSVKYNIFETILEWMEINNPNNIKEARRITVTDALNVFLKIDVSKIKLQNVQAIVHFAKIKLFQ